eukprot:COSAG04_NODE_20553_length_391_cov_0.719178_2_plen_45_part_01
MLPLRHEGRRSLRARLSTLTPLMAAQPPPAKRRKRSAAAAEERHR